MSENEFILLDHPIHHHQLILTEFDGTRRNQCEGCLRCFFYGEAIYVCTHRCSYPLLHEACAEMPREITLSLHPQHTSSKSKAIVFAQSATMGSTLATAAVLALADSKSTQFAEEHRSDGCNFTCHLDRYHLHDHPLSLAYGLPLEYIEYHLEECQVCYKELLPRYWVYHCGLCKYVSHINCALSTTALMMSNTDDDTNVVAFPINDASEEIIGPFVAKLGIPAISHDNEIVKGKYKLHNPDHQLRLISPSLHDQEENDNSDDDVDLNCGLKSKLVCDGCTGPISSLNKYVSCGECNYIVHLTCFQLPVELSSHPFHQEPHHILTLQTPPTLDSVFCNICQFYTNGHFYGCTKCDFKVDIKCVSLPDTIKHETHLRHNLKLQTEEITRFGYIRPCRACNWSTWDRVSYKCDVCHIMFHAECALLPKQVSNRRWDKHLLLLTYNASANHPSKFYCEICEEYMNPKWWMYHCR
ncbi:uncharacterized protein LOC125197820 [Salvia hispanica]|uniref:uncharacterized protein LOC125197820 n=1 Tax=Salvia hispanica TaxID=49212 RepID=UPI00200990D8|nr:uncharacterized protein LOC125197820 [Salvia hispanica]